MGFLQGTRGNRRRPVAATVEESLELWFRGGRLKAGLPIPPCPAHEACRTRVSPQPAQCSALQARVPGVRLLPLLVLLGPCRWNGLARPGPRPRGWRGASVPGLFPAPVSRQPLWAFCRAGP